MTAVSPNLRFPLSLGPCSCEHTWGTARCPPGVGAGRCRLAAGRGQSLSPASQVPRLVQRGTAAESNHLSLQGGFSRGPHTTIPLWEQSIGLGCCNGRQGLVLLSIGCNSGPRRQHCLRGSCRHNGPADFFTEDRRFSKGRHLLLGTGTTSRNHHLRTRLLFLLGLCLHFFPTCLHPGLFWCVRNVL